MEIYNAANLWLSHKNCERNKHAKALFLSVRFPLLSEAVTESLLGERQGLNNYSSFHKNSDCRALINKVLDNKKEFYKNNSVSYYTSRYCCSSKFSILICGGRYYKELRRIISTFVYKTGVKNLNKIQPFTQKVGRKYIESAFFIKGELYFICLQMDKTGNWCYSFEKYSPRSKTWKTFPFHPKYSSQ